MSGRVRKKNDDRFAELVASGRVRPLFGSRVVAITPASVRLESAGATLELPNDDVFVFAGGEPPFELLRHAGVRFGGEHAKPRGAA